MPEAGRGRGCWLITATCRDEKFSLFNGIFMAVMVFDSF